MNQITPVLSQPYEVDPADFRTWQFSDACHQSHMLVYRLRDAELNLLYVGITWSPRYRWAKHRRTKPWWARVMYAELQCCPTEQAALAVERAAIQGELPRFNKRGGIA